MGSNAKKKTTMAKLNRERKLRERREEKQAKKEARRQASGDGSAHPATRQQPEIPLRPGVGEDALDTVVEIPIDP